MSGKIPVDYNGRNLFICAPDINKKLRAEEIYRQTYYTSSFNETIQDDDILSFIVSIGAWTQEEADNLVKAEQDIETFKVELYNSLFRSHKEKLSRAALKLAKQEYTRLYNKRHHYDFLTPGGIASLAKTSYLVTMTTFDEFGQPIVDDYFSASMSLVNYLVEEYTRARLNETELRYLARTEPWRSYWNVSKKEGKLFDIIPACYSEDQKLLVLWSSLYDSIYENSDCPTEAVLQDDDMLDGWLILQRRKSDEGKIKKRGEDVVSNSKIKDSSEIFMLADSYEDAKKIDLLNDEEAKIRKKSKFDAIKKFGVISEGDMPDVKRDIQMKLNQMYMAKMKGQV